MKCIGGGGSYGNSIAITVIVCIAYFEEWRYREVMKSVAGASEEVGSGVGVGMVMM